MVEPHAILMNGSWRPFFKCRDSTVGRFRAHCRDV